MAKSVLFCMIHGFQGLSLWFTALEMWHVLTCLDDPWGPWGAQGVPKEDSPRFSE